VANDKYILTRYETIRRTEQVEYTVDIPEDIEDKITYAEEQISDSDYTHCDVVGIVDSEFLDEEIVSLQKLP